MRKKHFSRILALALSAVMVTSSFSGMGIHTALAADIQDEVSVTSQTEEQVSMEDTTETPAVSEDSESEMSEDAAIAEESAAADFMAQETNSAPYLTLTGQPKVFNEFTGTGYIITIYASAFYNTNIPEEDLSFEWYVGDPDEVSPDCDNVSYTYTIYSAEEGYTYYNCKISDKNAADGIDPIWVNFTIYGETPYLNVVNQEIEVDALAGKTKKLSVEEDNIDTNLDSKELVYTWYSFDHSIGDWKIIKGQKSSSYTVTDVAEGNSMYACEVSSDYDNVEDQWITFYIDAEDPYLNLYYQETEENRYEGPYYVPYDSDKALHLSVGLSTNIPLDSLEVTYKWYKDDVTDECEILETDSSTYELTHLKKNTFFYCVAVDEKENIQSEPLTFEVVIDNIADLDPNSRESEEPCPVGVTYGDNVTLKAGVTATYSNNIVYEWKNEDDEILQKGASDSFTVNNVTEPCFYNCTFTDEFGNTDTVYYKVYPQNHLWLSYSKYAYTGTNKYATLSVKAYADDMSGLTYQWYAVDPEYDGPEYDDPENDEGLELIKGAVNSYYVKAEADYNYCCKVKDRYGNVQKALFKVESTAASWLLEYDRDIFVIEGNDVTLKVKAINAKASDGLTYQWYYEEEKIQGETSNTLTVKCPDDPASYSCEVIDKYDLSEEAYFSVNPVHPDTFQFKTSESQISLKPGETAALKPELIKGADVNGSITYQWYKNDEPIEGATTATYIADPPESADDSDTYECKASYYDSDGSSGEANTSFVVCLDSSYVETVTKDISVNCGDSVSLTVDEDDIAGLGYAPYYKFKEIQDEENDTGRVLSNTKDASITIPAVYKDVKIECELSKAFYSNDQCDKKIVFNISVNGEHTHSFGAYKTNAATCTDDATKTAVCAECGDCDTQTLAKTALGHKYGSWKVTKAATVWSTGTKTCKCTRCGAVKTASIAKLKATIKLSVSSIPLQIKKSVSLTSRVTGLAKGDSISKWSSSNTRIAKVSKGKVTALSKTGTAKIYVTTKAGAKATFTIKVQKSAVKTSKISVNVKSVTVKKGKTFTIKASATPITSSQKITYKTSNKKIATVSSKGVVKGKKAGKATITVKSGSKKTTVKVKVK